MKVVFVLLGFVLFLYGAFLLYLWVFQNTFVFFPQKLDRDTPIPNGEEVWMTMDDGTKLHGALYVHENPKGFVLYTHGNAGNVLSNEKTCLWYQAQGYTCFSYDYRGFGKSEGVNKDKKQMVEDLETVYETVQGLAKDLPIVLHGYSLGTSAVSYLSKYSVAKIICVSGPTSFGHVAKARFPFVPLFLFRYDFRNYQNFLKNHDDVLLIHGILDTVIPYSHFEQYKRLLYGQPNYTFVSLENTGHSVEGNPEYWEAIKYFIES